ncbi:hypothetical protein [uncultured Roseobacter sp.]|uniref:hypothetical protein n=1 Tax=uncultured Roseobacter sp. TaxID=114847 RepID=UPI00260CCE38|nr:hypothetical protein [uncultured Roseobacter sp.]
MTIRTILIALPTLFAGWIAVLVFVGLMTDAAPASVVLFPSQSFLANLPSDVSIIGSSRVSVTLVSDQPKFAGALYGSGAWVVLPAGLPGCLPLPKNAHPSTAG